MSTTEIATTRLTASQAKALDKKIRAASDRVIRDLTNAADNYQKLLDLIDQAQRGEIHTALGIKSWTLWFKDTVQLTFTDRDERKELVRIMSGKGMSTRAIADVLNVGKSTVSRDVDSTAPNGTVESLDGRRRPSKPEPSEPEQEPLDVEEVEPPPVDAPKLPPLTEDFRNEVDNLRICVQAFKDIFADDRFPQARNRIAKLKAYTLFDNAVDELEQMSDVGRGDT
jgi:hypothetical protein